MAVDTDAANLEKMTSAKPIQIGEGLPNGPCPPGNVSKGREAALASRDALLEAMRDTETLVIVAGLGGSTGTGAAPVVLKLADELGLDTVALLTTPFRFEGAKCAAVAETTLLEIKQLSHMVYTISNIEQVNTAPPNAAMSDISNLAKFAEVLRGLMEEADL